jgi:hypothetical protein
MARWIKIAEIGDIAPGLGKVFEVDGRSVAVFNVNGTLYAIATRLTIVVRIKGHRWQRAALMGALSLVVRTG